MPRFIGSPAVTPPPTDAFDLSAAPGGGWSWFGDPRAVHYGTTSYYTYVRGDTGGIAIRTVPDSTLVASSEITLTTPFEIDDHAVPSLLVRSSDHKLLAFASAHNGASMWLYVSTNSLDTDPTVSGGFAARVNLDTQLGGNLYTYPNPIELSDGIYLIWRDLSGTQMRFAMSRSTDNGVTWPAATIVMRPSHASGYMYWKVCANGTNRIDVAITNDAPLAGLGNTNLYGMYFNATAQTWHTNDGTEITAAKPFVPSWGSLIHDSAGSGPDFPSAWISDIAVSGGNPVVCYPTYPTQTDHRYKYAVWNGSAWVANEICAGGSYIDGAGSWPYSGDMTLDHADPQRVIASRQVSGQFEIYLYVTADAGASFTETAITTASAEKQVRPVFVLGHSTELQAIWMAGTYDGFTSYNVGTRGVGA